MKLLSVVPVFYFTSFLHVMSYREAKEISLEFLGGKFQNIFPFYRDRAAAACLAKFSSHNNAFCQSVIIY